MGRSLLKRGIARCLFIYLFFSYFLSFFCLCVLGESVFLVASWHVLLIFFVFSLFFVSLLPS